ncbi:MAG: alpha-galactosidase [Clostridia bacterium]|nr:alpha-galactosidase [Clostridia bacterium]
MEKLTELSCLQNARFAFAALDENGVAFQADGEKWGIQVCVERVQDGFRLQRTVKNISAQTLRLGGLRLVLSGLALGGKAEDDYFYCNENARLFCNLTVPLDYNRQDDNAEESKKFHLPVDRKWCDPGVAVGRICSAPYQPFPAILLSNYGTKRGLVCGSLSQDVFYHSYEVGHNECGAFLEVYSAFKNIAYREVETGEELVDILYIGETQNADDINLIFENYTSVLREYLKDNHGASDTNRHSLVWDSWNDGIFRDVSEEMLLAEAKAVKRLFPTVEWFQLDDGYSSYCHENVDLDAHGLGVAYEGDEGVDSVKFPNGLKGYTDKVKALGLKPAIWIGG